MESAEPNMESALAKLSLEPPHPNTCPRQKIWGLRGIYMKYIGDSEDKMTQKDEYDELGKL